MKRLTRSLAICGVVGILSSISVSLFLAWCARLPRIGHVSLAAACERANTWALRVSVFVVVIVLGIMGVIVRELWRRTLDDLGPTTRKTEADEEKSQDE